jgi:hypothetical protein
MTQVDIPTRRDLPASWVQVQKEHLLAELVVHDRRRAHGGRVRLVALAAAVAVAALLSIPAFGVGPKIVSLFAGGHDPDAPAPTASDVVIASGEAGVAWRILATTSDQGLCLDLFHRAGGDRFGGACGGYVDVRGDLPLDVRGDPASKCLATPTTVVPCGSLPRHWIGPVGAEGGTVGLDHHFAFGPLAEEVASVELMLTDGQTLHARVVEQPGRLPLNVFWAAWPCRARPVLEGPYADEGLEYCVAGPLVKIAIARDAAGRVLERRVPAWNGNPTGDPEGPTPPSQGP